tara:strand:- start:17076 stop:19196 length:2121 start_codon:yes stop_codon:yes gene_type:complete
VVERSYKYLNEIELNFVKGIGEKKFASLKKSKLKTINDLIRYFPRTHIDRSKVKLVSEIEQNDQTYEVTIFGTIDKLSVFTTKTRLRIATLTISDESGSLKAKWFGPQYIESRFKEGDVVAVSGKPEVKKTGSIEFKNPAIEKFTDVEELNQTGSLIPIYKKVEGMTSASIRKGLKEIINILESTKDNFEPGLFDVLPSNIREEYSLLDRFESIKKIHFPKNENDYKSARRRLVLDEFIYLRSIFANLKSKHKNENKGLVYKFTNPDIEEFVKQLPFNLTQSQNSAMNEILEDLKKTYPMKRLLQGDVGSGKTVVATIASYAAIKSDYQVALMAPTEVLAEQHYSSINEFMNKDQYEIHLLTSSVKNRDKILENLKNGNPGLYVGTHALIQESIKFSNLGLAIIDEQQRFGVEQRKKLINETGDIPDQLVMTATPIPRTTALSIYGDLEISSINELPPGRKDITSHLIEGSKKDNDIIYDICKFHLKRKSQIFVVCPFIEESEVMDIQAAENVFIEYKEKFKDYKVSILHGKMSFDEKEQIMQDMKSGKIDILVSTIVIEVGIDIPNATLMIIESAERFGLNQLHQLRGRVGRSDKQSECVFHVSKKKTLKTISEDGKRRLEAIVDIKDGFRLSEIDLEIRGEGKVTGTSQSGQSDLKIADLRYDYKLLLESKNIFDQLESEDIKNLLFEEAQILFPNYFKASGTT